MCSEENTYMLKTKIVVHSCSVFQPESYLCKFIYGQVTWPDLFLKDCML